MILRSGEAVSVSNPGPHVMQVSIGTGTALLEISVGGLPYETVPSSSVSASTVVKITLPSSKIRATLTGDATMAINPAGE